MSDTIRHCPKCGSLIPTEAPQGLCPKCVLQQAATGTEAGQTYAAKPVPPSLEELATAFPHLQIIELVGQGGMGFVFRARQPKLDRFVAVKILPQTLALDPAFAERFQREARVLAKLNHPNIVTIFDFGQAGGFFFLLMEFVDGVNLREAMKLGKFAPAQALDIVPKICDALHFAHNEGILHRDIKPENILLDSRGRVKIADFGIAKILGTENVTETKDAAPAQQNVTGVVGTPNYMAPEQLATPGKVDQRADIYSLGVVFYEMLTGELPGGSVVPPSQKSPVDARIDEIVMRTLEKERERRQKSADEVKTQVETIAEAPRSQHAHALPLGNYDYRSKQTILGLPLVHVTWGADGKELRTAKGIVAVGPRAVGLAAVGFEAYGLLACGILALGLAPVGMIAVGGVAAGLFAIGLQSTGLIGSGHYATALIRLSAGATLALLALSYIAVRLGRREFFRQMHAAAAEGAPPVIGNPAPVAASSSFWKRFGIGIAALIATPFVIGILAVILAIVIPAMSKSKHGSSLRPPLAPSAPARALFDGKRSARPTRVFGPSRDQVIESRETKTNCFFDLDSGNLLTPSVAVVHAIEKNPDRGATTERTWETRDIRNNSVPAYRYVQWIRETGADLLYMGDGRIVTFDCLLIPAHGDSSTNWDDINSVSPEQWQRATAALQWAQASREAERHHLKLPEPPNQVGGLNAATLLDSQTPNGPRVNEITIDQSHLWHFKTKRGAEGILEIVGSTNNPSTVTILYKVLLPAKRSSETSHDVKQIVFGQPQLQVSSNGCSALTLSTETPMASLEHLFSVVDFSPNGAMRHVKFTEQTNSTPQGAKLVHVLTWSFGGNLDQTFTQREADLALQQLNQNANRSYRMVAGEQIPMFTVTNGTGEVLIGFVEYHHHYDGATATPIEKIASVSH